jgi:hypothetical protein
VSCFVAYAFNKSSKLIAPACIDSGGGDDDDEDEAVDSDDDRSLFCEIAFVKEGAYEV